MEEREQREQLYNALPDTFTHSGAVKVAKGLNMDVSASTVRSWIAVWRFRGMSGFRDDKYIKVTPK